MVIPETKDFLLIFLGFLISMVIWGFGKYLFKKYVGASKEEDHALGNTRKGP